MESFTVSTTRCYCYQGRSMVFPFRYAKEGGLRASRGSGKMLFFRGLEMPFPMFFRGKFHKSKHEKTLTIQ